MVDRSRQRLATGLRLPTGLHPALATAVAVQVGTAAYGIASQTVAGLVVALAGVAVFLGVAALALYRFRRINGVRVDGLASQIVLGSGAMPTLVYVGTFLAATWAAFESRWWLVAVAAVAGGVGMRTASAGGGTPTAPTRSPTPAAPPPRTHRARRRRLPGPRRAAGRRLMVEPTR